MHWRFRTVLWLLVAAGAGQLLVPSAQIVAPVQAQEDRRAARERELMRRMQLELQQLNQRLADLEADNARLSAQSADQDKTIRKLRAQLGGKEKDEVRLRSGFDDRVQKLQADLEAERTRAFEANERVAIMMSRDREQVRVITRLEEDKLVLLQRLSNQLDIIARQAALVRTGREKNAALYEIASDLVGRWRDKSVMDALLQNEPFTQIEWVRMQNELREYDEKLRTQQLEIPDLGG